MSHDPNKIIDALGGTAETARMFNIAPPSVSEWRRLGIPRARLMYIEVVRPDLFGKSKGSAKNFKVSP